MKTRPRELTSLALILAGIALSIPVQIMFLFGDSPFEPLDLLNKLSPLNWAIIALALILIPLTLRASLAFWVFAPAFLVCVGWNNWLVAALSHHSWLSAESASCLGAFVLFVGLLLRPSCRRALTHPGSRWWLTPARKKVQLEARICPVLGGEMNAETFDLSESGAFITTQQASWRGSRFRSPEVYKKNLAVGSYCWLRVALNEVTAFSCNAEIVRKSDARGSYPEGIGLRFVGLTAREKKILYGFLKSMNQSSVPQLVTQSVMTQVQTKSAA